jgi:hypothetical protein
MPPCRQKYAARRCSVSRIPKSPYSLRFFLKVENSLLARESCDKSATPRNNIRCYCQLGERRCFPAKAATVRWMPLEEPRIFLRGPLVRPNRRILSPIWKSGRAAGSRIFGGQRPVTRWTHIEPGCSFSHYMLCQTALRKARKIALLGFLRCIGSIGTGRRNLRRAKEKLLNWKKKLRPRGRNCNVFWTAT